MADSRILAEQASALPEDALRESEKRAAASIADAGRIAAEARAEVAETSRLAADLAGAESERLRDIVKDRDARIMQLVAELEAVKSERTARHEQGQRDRADIERLERSRQTLDTELTAAREHIACLEQELRDERECTDNLSEVANERRGLITSLEDRLAEAEERYEEARWRLGKAQHFERLVKRRKKLIFALLERIRQKHKANVALKAGLDGLRTYKAAAELKHHDLLKRMDKLTAKVREQEETIARHSGSTVARADLTAAQIRIGELEQRAESQLERIRSLEEELKMARALQQVRTDHGAEIELLRNENARLRADLDAKREVVTRLEDDAGEQQRRLAKLLGTETETLRLKAQLKEQEATIRKLTRELDDWRQKFELGGDDSRRALRSAAEK